MPLKPEFRATALAALRSPLYTQEHGSAGTIDGAKCCIAVSAVANGYKPLDGIPILLTAACAEYIGLTHEEMIQWSYWNDVRRFTLPEIATLIEKGISE